MPTNKEIRNKVNIDVAEYAGYPIDKLEDGFELKGRPLKMDDSSLNFLTQSLRAYVKKHNAEQTLLAKEVKKSGRTLKSLGELIIDKIKV